MRKKIKLLVVDDHPLVRKGILLCAAHSLNLDVVGELDDARKVVEEARRLRPDVVLMDIAMPHVSGLTATCLLRRELPEIKVVILSVHDHPHNLRQAMQAGAWGYVLKGTPTEQLVDAVEAVHGGETYFKADMMRVTPAELLEEDQTGRPQLTERELEVLVLIAEGRSNKEAAAALGLSVRTVESYRENLMDKLDIHSIAGLVRFAVANGYVSARPTPWGRSPDSPQ